jgi:hypothetical protein
VKNRRISAATRTRGVSGPVDARHPLVNFLPARFVGRGTRTSACDSASTQKKGTPMSKRGSHDGGGGKGGGGKGGGGGQSGGSKGGGGGGNWPSTTGNPSGGGRGNNPPSR